MNRRSHQWAISVMANDCGVREETVNTASRMESHSESGKIATTEHVYEKVKGLYEFEVRDSVFVKGIGRMKMYFLQGPRKLAISKYSAGEKRAVCTPFCVNFCVIGVLRLPCSVGAKWIYAPSRMLYRTVVTPMPKASVRMAPAVNPGIRRSCRTA